MVTDFIFPFFIPSIYGIIKKKATNKFNFQIEKSKFQKDVEIKLLAVIWGNKTSCLILIKIITLTNSFMSMFHSRID